MKGKIALLLAISILLGCTIIFLTSKAVIYRKLLYDREMQITQYNRILGTIISNTEIDFNDIENDLTKSFIIRSAGINSEKIETIILEPKSLEVLDESLWDFRGLIEVQLTETGRVTYVWNFKQ